MKNVVLFCAGGMSTGLIVKKMKDEAARLGKDYQIAAYGLAEADAYAPTADVILVGPQVRYAVDKLKAEYPDKPIQFIEMKVYGMMDGAKILHIAMKAMGEE